MTARRAPDPKTEDDRRAEIARRIRYHADQIARLTRELADAPEPSSMFVRNAVTRDQFRASLRAMGKL